MRQRVTISGVEFDPIKQAALLSAIERHIAKGKGSFLVFKPYVEFLAAAQKDPRVSELLNQADRVVADGVAVQWAASYLAGPTGVGRWLRSLIIDVQRSAWRNAVIPERGAGVTATRKLLERAEELGWRVGILGGPAETDQTQVALMERFPKLQLVDVKSGYFDSNAESALVTDLQKDRLDLLFVAMGFPRQEEFIVRHRSDRIAKVLVGEGGTFDYDELGGPLKRAPKWVRSIGFEWLWRLWQQPSRWRRQASIPRFLVAIYREGREKSR